MKTAVDSFPPQTENFLDKIVANIPNMVGYWTKDLHCTFANKGYLTWFGRTNQQMLGIRMEDLLGAELFKKNERYIRAVLRGEDQQFERTLIKANGQVGHTWAQYIAHKVDGQVQGFFVLVTDITEVKQAQDALRASEQQFHSLIDAIPQHVWSTNADGRLHYVSQRVTDYFGCTFEDMINNGWKRYVHADDVPEIIKQWAHCVETGKNYEIEYRLKRASDGSYRWHLGRAVPLRDREGNIIKWLGTNTDITERKEFEQDLKISHAHLEKKVAERTIELKMAEKTARKLSKELTHLNRLFIFDEMSSSIIHQLSQPLGSIANNTSTVQLLLAKKGKATEAQKILTDILKDCERTRDILIKNRSMLRKNEYILKEINLDDVISSVLEAVECNLVFNKVSVIFDKKVSVKVKADKIHLEQVFLNLIMNAIESMQESSKKELRIGTELSTADKVVVSISDSGRGFSKETKKNLFKPFFTTKEGGLGLGLPICRSIIESHQGTFWGENNPKKGATFYFSLPVIKAKRT